MRIADFKLVHRLRVRWAEVDRQGIVFNGHYLTFFDVAVTEYWRTIGVRYPEDIVANGSDIFAVKAVLEYHAPALYDDLLDVCARVSKIGRSSMQFELAIFRSNERLVSGQLIYVNADSGTRKSLPVPDFLRLAIGGFEEAEL